MGVVKCSKVFNRSRMQINFMFIFLFINKQLLLMAYDCGTAAHWGILYIRNKSKVFYLNKIKIALRKDQVEFRFLKHAVCITTEHK